MDLIVKSHVLLWFFQVRVEETASSEVHEEEVFAFGYKKRCREQTSSVVNTHGTLMGYTRVRPDTPKISNDFCILSV